MRRYPGLIEDETGAHGVTFPDMPSVTAMASTIEEAVANAEAVLRGHEGRFLAKAAHRH